MSDHTPTPWVLSGKATIKADHVGIAPVYIATLEQGQHRVANAEFILRAVNAHDDLVAALKPFASLADEIEQCCSEYAENAPERDPENWAKACSWEDLVRARAAVAKAESRS